MPELVPMLRDVDGEKLTKCMVQVTGLLVLITGVAGSLVLTAQVTAVLISHLWLGKPKGG